MLRDLADLVLPRRCAGCGSAGELLCQQCCPSPPGIALRRAGVRVRAAGAYRDGLRAAVLAYKERGRRDLAGPLGELLAVAAMPLAGPGTVLVPVASSASAARRRGGDHLLRLARRAGDLCGVAVVSALYLARRVDDSAGLGTRERRVNLAGAIQARAGPAGRFAVVVDDIVTSGTTLAESARALRAAGWPVLGGAVIAATPWRAGAEVDSSVAAALVMGADSANLPSSTSARSRLAWF